MCIILSGETHPESTKLVNIPVTIQNHKYNLAMYINSISNKKTNDGSNINRNFVNRNIVVEIPGRRNPRLFGNLELDPIYNEIDGNDTFETLDQTRNISTLMVVPYPLDKYMTRPTIGLVDMSVTEMKNFVTDLKTFPTTRPVYKSRGQYMANSVNFGTDTLKVYDVGDYKISIAQSVDDLLTRIDWKQFRKPSDFDTRVATFNNNNLYSSSYDWFYIVAEAKSDIMNDGFGVLYPRLRDGAVYFPTAHEESGKEIMKFDVDCYAFMDRKSKVPSASYSDKEKIHSILKKIDKRVGTFNNGARARYHIDFAEADKVYVLSEYSEYENHNLYL